ncbi:MAG TPA: hypothetical protein VGE76_02510 [Opitutaceae bacterium]
MKTAALLLAASLTANAALVGVLVLRRDAPAPSSSARPAAAPAKTTGSTLSADALRAALASGDTAALAAAGFSPEAIRELTVGRSLVRALERARAAKAGQGDGRWWRSNRANPLAAREQQLQARREITEALAAAGLEDPGLFTPTDGAQLFAFLSPEKRDALRRITQDYDELMLKFSSGGIQLASDRERLKLLRAERDRDIAALLSPAELEAYEMRTSPTAASVRARFGDGIESEEDFRKIYALQKAFDEKYPLDLGGGRVSPETMRQRADAQRQLQEDIRAAVGAEAYASLQRASDYDLRNLDSLATRLQLPAGTTDRVAASRESYAAESQRINADTSLTPAQRREQIQALGNRAKGEITQALGQEAGDAYAQRSGWVSMLQSGMAYGTQQTGNGGASPLGSGSVYVVPPAGANTNTNMRQTVTVAAPVGGGDFIGVSDGVLLGGGGVVEGARVMTFTSSETSGTAPAAGTTTRVISAPKTDPVATPPAKE